MALKYDYETRERVFRLFLERRQEAPEESESASFRRLHELVGYSLEGELLGEVPGFEGPMGMALAPSGDICVTEMGAGRITCKPIEWFQSNHLE